MADDSHQLMLDETETRIGDMIAAGKLVGLLAANVERRFVPSFEKMTYPACVIVPAGELLSGGNNEEDVVGYGILIGIAQAGNAEMHNNTRQNQELKWRSELRSEFHNKRFLSGESRPARMEAGEPIVINLFRQMLNGQWWLMRVPKLEGRAA